MILLWIGIIQGCEFEREEVLMVFKCDMFFQYNAGIKPERIVSHLEFGNIYRWCPLIFRNAVGMEAEITISGKISSRDIYFTF